MRIKDNIWIFSDLMGRYAELAGGAVALGGKAQALVVGTRDDATAVAATGVTTVHAMTFEASRSVDDYLPGMVKVIQESGDAFLVFVAATRRGRLMAARLAARLDAAVVSDVNGVRVDGDALLVTHSVYGGLAQATEKIVGPRAVLLVTPGVFDPIEGAAAGTVQDAAAELADATKCLGHHPKQGSTVELGRARRVVSVGRGLKSKDDLTMVQALAKALDAEIGCSRPLAEGENWLEHERYVGITGVKLKADVYMALGISGQIQHMAGVDACRTIVAINKDKNAPIFQYADYGLVGDIYKVVPALVKVLGQ